MKPALHRYLSRIVSLENALRTLIADFDSIIEECAKVCDERHADWKDSPHDSIEQEHAMEAYMCALEIRALKRSTPEARAIRWMVALQTDRGYLIEGHPYVSRESAQGDVDLITARGERAEVWECYRCEPQRDT